MAKSRCELSAPVFKMLVVSSSCELLTHFRFTDNQHDQGQGPKGVGVFLAKGARLGDFCKGILDCGLMHRIVHT